MYLYWSSSTSIRSSVASDVGWLDGAFTCVPRPIAELPTSGGAATDNDAPDNKVSRTAGTRNR
jgi:hypothetical protein